MRMIKINPFSLQHIPNPTEEMKLTALRENGLVLEFIDHPTKEMKLVALKNTAKAIQFIPDAPKELLEQAVHKSWTNLAYIKHPPEWLIMEAISQSGWAIQYAENPSEELQMAAIEQNYDAIRYIKHPTPRVQAAAAAINYTALRYIDKPSFEAQCIAIANNEQAIRLFVDTDTETLLTFLKINILVIRYLPRNRLVSNDDLKRVLKETLSRDDVPEKYVRDFIDCRRIETDYGWSPVDKLLFVYRYGSRKAKQITVDEKLKIQKSHTTCFRRYTVSSLPFAGHRLLY